MPAVFHLEAPVSPPKLDLSSASSQLFQVPSSASASSSLYNSISSSRKRARRDTGMLSSRFEAPSDLPSPSPLIQNNYPQTTDYHTSAELDFRPNRYRESFLPPSLDGSVESVVPAETTGNSRKRSRCDSCVASPSADAPSSTGTPVGWGRTVIKAVGKVLDFCWSGAFRGFYAGGGQAYAMTAGSAPQLDHSSSPSAGKDNTFSPHGAHLTPIPGQFPDEDIRRNWVVVPTDSNDPFVDASSPSLRPRKFHQTSSPRRRPAVTPRMGRRVVRSSTRPSTPTKNQGLPSPRSRDGPASADVQRYAAQMRRKERQEDASIARLNKQLQAMIREGKEALGTTVEVDDMDMEDYD